MNTTNELPPPTIEEKIDRLTQLVHVCLERMDKQDEDSRLRYVDLRQRIEKQDERLAQIEERQLQMEGRQIRMEESQTEIRQQVNFLVKNFYTIDRKLDVFVSEFHIWKDRVRELEDTRELRH